MKKQKLPQQLQVWADARQRYHLTDAQVQMARELGLNPLKFGKIANEKQEPWKVKDRLRSTLPTQNRPRMGTLTRLILNRHRGRYRPCVANVPQTNLWLFAPNI